MNSLSELLVGTKIEDENSDIIKIRNNLQVTISNFSSELLDLDLKIEEEIGGWYTKMKP